MPLELDRYTIHKGSITLDGVSLTVAALDDHVLGVAIIPHTYQNTIIRTYAPGSVINVEVDLIGKYVEKLMAKSD
jgi:riboflavin synthase